MPMGTVKKMTLEEAWNILAELAKSQKETDRQLKGLGKSQEETDRQLRETDRQLRETDRQLKGLGKSQEETDRQLKGLGKSQEETDRQLRESDRQLKASATELQEQSKKMMKSIDKTNGNFNSKWGTFLEDLVQGDLVNLLNKKGIEVSKINSRVKYLHPNRSVGAEYDLIAVNGSEIVVFEVKTTLSNENLNSFLAKLMKFRDHFPEYSDKKFMVELLI